MKHTELAELILDESGYTGIVQPTRASRPRPARELEGTRALHARIRNARSLLEHVSLVMDTEQADDGDRVSLMTLHAAKGLEFDTVFLPAGRKASSPISARSMKAAKKASRRSAVLLTSASRVRSAWPRSRLPRTAARAVFISRQFPRAFVDDLPEDHVEVLEAKSPFGGAYQNFANPFDRMQPYGKSRFDEAPPSRFKAAYETPGWQRAKANEQKSFGDNWSRDGTVSATPPCGRPSPSTARSSPHRRHRRDTWSATASAIRSSAPAR